ncbi:MAG: divalent-cation tolerance protein CutA [Acidobacteria bacterium]|nr:divalent-cation tolerance protein CutA [Acidobacteriota bacterium]
MSKQVMVVLSTAPDEVVGSRIAAALVERRLAACVNIVSGVRSLYWWEGKVRDDAEVLLICKTDDSHLGELTAVLEELHPYDCPEVVALPVTGGSTAYLRWIGESLG